MQPTRALRAYRARSAAPIIIYNDARRALWANLSLRALCTNFSSRALRTGQSAATFHNDDFTARSLCSRGALNAYRPLRADYTDFSPRALGTNLSPRALGTLDNLSAATIDYDDVSFRTLRTYRAYRTLRARHTGNALRANLSNFSTRAL